MTHQEKWRERETARFIAEGFEPDAAQELTELAWQQYLALLGWPKFKDEAA